ncbi:MAG: DEAD/DEAH box helicase [Flavitalea sp.]
MKSKSTTIGEKNPRKLYNYQAKDLETIFNRLENDYETDRLLYQLPTGGGKTVVFSAIAKRFLKKFKRKVLILTHRIELCRQTATTLDYFKVKNKVIDSSAKIIKKNSSDCYVAMVETLNNRIEEGTMCTEGIGLVIIDEAHYNAFHKLLEKFPYAQIIGVTATPLSSDAAHPMNDTYKELITGESIANLIDQGYLARPKAVTYEVELNTLTKGSSGDFTISTSDELYSSPGMMELLMNAYMANSRNKKTLIFNNGIFTSKNVCRMFEEAGYPVKHLDNHNTIEERADILAWFKKTKGAILTSVSILTTGFDEPSVQTIILNRATTSLTLYHQMVGRGSRKLPNKKSFTIIDLGNNGERFGSWESPVDWQFIFRNPTEYIDSINAHLSQEMHNFSPEHRAVFSNSTDVNFDVQAAHRKAVDDHQKPFNVIIESINQHALMCVDNAETTTEAITLIKYLESEINWRIKQYTKCLGNVTKSYREWLHEDYRERLQLAIRTMMQKSVSLAQTA